MKRPLWRAGGALALALVVCCGVAPVWAQDAKDPEAALKEINTWYTEQLTKARSENRQPNFTELLKERTDRAKTAVKDFDAEKVEPAKGFALAQLYQIVQDHPHAVVAAKRYLTTNPEGAQRYTAHNLLLSSYAATDDAEGIIGVLGEMKPPTTQMAAFLAANVGARYAEIVADKKGVKAGLDLIAKAEAAVPFDEMLAKPDVPGRDGKPGPAPEKSAAETAIVQIALGRSGLLEKAGRKDEALAVLEAGKKKLPEGSRMIRGLESKIKLAKIVGIPAPALKQDRGYGDFKSLDAYKGKVVVVEFTAHW